MADATLKELAKAVFSLSVRTGSGHLGIGDAKRISALSFMIPCALRQDPWEATRIRRRAK